MSSDDLLVFNVNNEGKLFNFIVLLKIPNLLLLFLNGGTFMT